ncbi:ketopantoate reductase family protein [Oceanobacillus bengalensis]|uniref:2-dehydropantoate 2-reductase n=1 Tax=Oceanobacillus bengalensis TaxID=1435466 RepID=A0A494YUL4_9BACI|nr:2-dehydropantoate 2-reductase [Oceanobacillus bengalensis]RKQ13789.1 2-dehydropantoate 2-reductase [Oceanobacillus bengalensis]
MKIAIMGAGSLGTIIGAYLSKGKKHVELIDVNKEHVEALNLSGATITGTVEENIPVRAITPEEMDGNYDLVLLLTKQMFNQDVLSNLQSHLNDNSIVLSLQNGVPEDSLASIIGKNRVIGGSVEFGATWVKPGVSELTTTEEAFKANAFQIGELDGTITDRIHQIKEVLDLVGNISISDNLAGTKWAKLLVNVAMSGMSTALGCTYGDVLDNESAVTSAVMLADETIKVGQATGVEFAELAGFNLGIFNLAEDKSNLPQAIGFTKIAFGPQALLKPSMLQDLEKQRKSEIDYINGVISSNGRETTINTPFNDLLVRLVKRAEEEKIVPNFEQNLSYFKELL